MIAALRAAEIERSGGQKGRGLGGRNFCPPSLSDSSFSAAAEFRASVSWRAALNFQISQFCPTNHFLNKNFFPEIAGDVLYSLSYLIASNLFTRSSMGGWVEKNNIRKDGLKGLTMKRWAVASYFGSPIKG